MALKDWKIKKKTKNYIIYYNSKIGETVSLWKGKPEQNRKARKYMREH